MWTDGVEEHSAFLRGSLEKILKRIYHGLHIHVQFTLTIFML